MTEVRRFTGSMPFAIFCSVAVQVSYHFYQGGPPALAHAGGFMVLACYYAKTNRILPPQWPFMKMKKGLENKG